ncbi:hypothetical protein ACHQM5_025454 [Ranunculus cassubicifolius]
MERREDPCNTVDESVIREKKRLRRVSFAENTEIHVFDRVEDEDDELSSGTPKQFPQLTSLVWREQSIHNNNHEFQLSSPGSSANSATSNDENVFFGPVVTDFIRLGGGGQLESPAVSEDHDNMTLDSTAFSMHFQSLARSDSSAANCKTPTSSYQGQNSIPTDTMVMTQVKKRLPFGSSSGGRDSSGGQSRDSNDMLLVGTRLSDKYNYGNLSPSLESFLAEIEKDKHRTPEPHQDRASMSPNRLYAESKVKMQITNSGDSSGGRDSKDRSLIRKSPSIDHYIGRASSVSDQMSVLMSPNRHNAESKVQLQACNSEELSTFGNGNSANECNSNDMVLITKSPSNVNGYGRTSPTLQSPQAESSIDQMSIIKSTAPLSSGSKPSQEVSKFEVLNEAGEEHSTDGHESDDMILIRNSPSSKYNYASPSHTLWSPQGARRNECVVGVQAFKAKEFNTSGGGDSIGGRESDGMVLIRNSPSTKYDYDRLSRASVSPHAENRNHMHHTSACDQANILKSSNSLVAESKAELHASVDKELNDTDRGAGESPFTKYGHERFISTLESLQDKSTNYMLCTSSIVDSTRNADNGKLSLSLESQLAQGIKDTHHTHVSDLKETTNLDISHAQPPTLPAQSLPLLLKLNQSDQMIVSKSPSNLNTDKIVQVPRTSKQKEVNNTDSAHPPTLMKGFALESQMDNSTVPKEVEKSKGHELQGQWDNALKEVPAAVEKLLFPLIDKLNSQGVDILEDVLGRMQKAIKYEKLSALVQFQKTNDPLGDDHQQRVLEARWLQETLVYEQAKLILLRTKQEQLQKQIQLVQSGIQETQRLKFSVNNILQDGTKYSQNKDVMLPSLLVDLSSENMDKVSAKEQELESVDIKIKNLSKSLLCGCKIKEEAGSDECILLVNEHLKKKTRCRLLQRKFQVYQVDSLERENDDDGCNLLVNYYNLLCQSFRMRNHLPKLVTCIRLKTENINKSFPNMNACTAFAFVFNEDESSSSNKRSLALETQVIRSHLHNLVMVMGEVQAACIELRNLIHATFFQSQCGGVLQLEVTFIEWKTGNKVSILVDMTCLKSGVYPRSPQISSASAFLKREIEAAGVKAAGCSAVYRLCVDVSQLLLASSC